MPIDDGAGMNNLNEIQQLRPKSVKPNKKDSIQTRNMSLTP
jgi:hypothetical protein